MASKAQSLQSEPPRTFTELKTWIQDHYDTLPKRLQSVAVFALDNPDVISLNTIAIISEQASVTDSTLIRFAKSIGYDGFTDMQSVFQESMRYIPQPYSERLNKLENEGNSTQSVLHQFSQAASASIDKLERQINEDDIVKASKVLAKARTVYIAGQGRTIPITTYLHYNLLKMGIQAVLIEGMTSVMTDKARLIRDDDALVAITFSPYAANTEDIANICLDNDVPVIALTDSLLSPIASSDSLHIELSEEEVGGIRGLSATMCLALCLAVETGKQLSSSSNKDK